MRIRLSILMIALVLSLTCHELRGQTLDTSILGTATDSSGAVLPGATITVLSPATGIKKTAVTGTSGEYAVTYLTPGTYDVTSRQRDLLRKGGQELSCSLISRIRLTSR